MVVNPPDPPDIHSFMEQFNSVAGHLPDMPDWFWKGMTVWAVGWAVGKSIEWTWKHREKIAEKLRPSRTPVLLSGTLEGKGGFGGTITVGSERQVLYDVRSTVGSERQALWNVEASTPPERLLDEGLELVSWYLRQR